MIEHEVLFWGTLWIQAGALLSLIAFRLPLGDQAHRFFHVLFYGSLAMVGSATVLALAVEAHCWICPAICLGVLIIGAACEPAPVPTSWESGSGS